MPHPPQRPSELPRPWRHAILTLDRAVRENAPRDNSEMIDVIGRKHFGILWDLQPGDPMPDLKSIN